MVALVKHYKVTTHSGSVYHVQGDGVLFYWLKSTKQVRTHDENLPVSGSYPLQQVAPWPPVAGHPMVMLAEHFTEPGHPLRLPGGGKITSPVQLVEELMPVMVTGIEA